MMPPIPTWFTRRDPVVGFLGSRVLRRPGLWRMLPTRANGQPSFVVYEHTGDGRYQAYGIQVLTLTGSPVTRIARVTAFNDPSLVTTFGFAAAVAGGR
jgi:RNA polymerase sigma-70 factor (ECF subfamily)